MRNAAAAITILAMGLLVFSATSFAGETAGTQISNILDHKASLSLTDSQVKKLEQVQKNAQVKMVEAKAQSQIRLSEIEKFSSDWTNMNSIAVMSLVKEYYKYLSDYKTAELEAVIQARSILEIEQLRKFQQLVSIEALVIRMEDKLAAR